MAHGSPMMAVRTAAGEFPRQRRGPELPDLERFAALAGRLEHAAAAIARLDTLLTGHPLAAAWAWRSRLDAVRRQAAADGRLEGDPAGDSAGASGNGGQRKTLQGRSRKWRNLPIARPGEGRMR